MSYAKQFDEAKKNKRNVSLVADYREWKKPGDFLLGKLLAKNEVESSLSAKPYMQYLFDTDDGLQKCALGGATDGEAGALMKIGLVYRIEFKGKEKLTGGRSLNKFEVLHVMNEMEAKAEIEDTTD